LVTSVQPKHFRITCRRLLNYPIRKCPAFSTGVTGDIHQGLNVLDNLFGNLFYGKLPAGRDWLDHLDILDAVRINSFGGLKKLQEFYPETLAGYVDIGIEKNSENHDKAVEILKNNNIAPNILVDHALNNNFMRLNIRKKSAIPSFLVDFDGKILCVPIPFSEEQKSAINSIYELYKHDDNIKQGNINLFLEEWDKRPNLKILKEWWDNISTAIQITAVGKVLAHSNAQRCDKNLPPVN
jgi:hypothetical protein